VFSRVRLRQTGQRAKNEQAKASGNPYAPVTGQCSAMQHAIPFDHCAAPGAAAQDKTDPERNVAAWVLLGDMES
jgi:hypothetical protein